MTLLVLGGHDRLEAPLRKFGLESGIKIKFINRPTQNLEDALESADVILVITSMVSHEMVKLAKKYGCSKCIFCKQRGVCQIKKEIKRILTEKNF
ncbi:MAG: DUF2325 domain-containing protein [Desulfurococcaceae archaeon]